MPRRYQRTKAYRRKYVRVPSGETRVRFERRKKKAKHVCALCKAPLRGVEEKGAKSERRPTRPFAGILCHSCLERVMKYAIRVREKVITMDDVEIRFRPYVAEVVKGSA